MKCFFLLRFAHFSKFSKYAWEKKVKVLVFQECMYCLKAKLTLVSFFLLFFLCTFPLATVKMIILPCTLRLVLFTLQVALQHLAAPCSPLCRLHCSTSTYLASASPLPLIIASFLLLISIFFRNKISMFALESPHLRF